MDDPPSPSENSSPSRRGSHVDTTIHGIPPHPKHVQPRRDSERPRSVNSSRQNSVSHVNVKVQTATEAIEMATESDGVNEQSPLLPPETTDQADELPPLRQVASPNESASGWIAAPPAEPELQSKSSWYLFLLTVSMSGLQIAWSVELSNGSPYLLSLGISKALLAIVWIAGPLSGTLVQPYVGIKSDRCRSRFGKRRPFMIGGAIATISSLMILAWAKEIVRGILGVLGVSKESKAVSVTTIVFAVLLIYILDFSINVIQAGIRAFIVDNAPTHQQDTANAWASRISGVGNIIGYLFGFVDLPKYLWFFGKTQFQVLCVLASLLMAITLTISCVSIKERDPRLENDPSNQHHRTFAFFKDLWHSFRRLPPPITRVCLVQFFAWIGWFPFLFYITTWIGEIYVQPYFEKNPNMSEEEVNNTWQRATRVGTFALFMFAIVTFTASVLLPFIVASSYKAPEIPIHAPMTLDAEEIPTPVPFSDNTARITKSRLSHFCARLPSPEIPWLTLRRAWMLSHLMFSTLTWLTFVARTTTSATVLVALIGIPWAMTNWAPFALIAAEISKRDNIRRGLVQTSHDDPLALPDEMEDRGDQAGVVLGIHNVAIAAPQIIATLVSSAIFRALQKPRGSVGDDSVAWVLRFGGACTLIAAWLTRRVFETRKT